MLKKTLVTLFTLSLTLGMAACNKSAVPTESAEGAAAQISSDTSRYAVFNETLNWDEARRRCEELGGHLVTITSQAEQDIVVSMLTNAESDTMRNCYFMGACDQMLDGNWQWVTGEPFDYINWKKNEPKPDKGEQYLEIFAKTYVGNSGTTEPGRWNDSMLDGLPYSGAGDESFFTPELTGFICEWDNTPIEVK
jgi:hypothetical protein